MNFNEDGAPPKCSLISLQQIIRDFMALCSECCRESGTAGSSTITEPGSAVPLELLHVVSLI